MKWFEKRNEPLSKIFLFFPTSSLFDNELSRRKKLCQTDWVSQSIFTLFQFARELWRMISIFHHLRQHPSTKYMQVNDASLFIRNQPSGRAIERKARYVEHSLGLAMYGWLSLPVSLSKTTEGGGRHSFPFDRRTPCLVEKVLFDFHHRPNDVGRVPYSRRSRTATE